MKRVAENKMEQRRKKALKKAMPKEPEKIVSINYDEVKIKRIQGRIVYINQALNSVRMEMSFQYMIDTDKISDARMAEALKHREGNASMMANIINKYSEDNDDSEDSNPGAGGEDALEVMKAAAAENDADDDSEADSEEGKAMEADAEPDSEDDDDGEGGKRKGATNGNKGFSTYKYPLFVNTYKLPILNPYAVFRFVLKPETKKFPPELEHLTLARVDNLTKANKPRKIGAMLAKLRKLAGWIGRVGFSQPALRSIAPFDCIASMLAVLELHTHKWLVLTLFRDYFRSDEFYTLLCLVPIQRLSRMTDAQCSRLFTDLITDRAWVHIFSYEMTPLSLREINKHLEYGMRAELKMLAIDVDADDTESYIQLHDEYMDGKIVENVPVEVTVCTPAMELASDLWSHWWTRSGLYKGVFSWSTEPHDLPAGMSPDQVKAAVGYLLYHKHIKMEKALTVDEEVYFLPRFLTLAWQLVRNCADLGEHEMTVKAYDGDLEQVRDSHYGLTKCRPLQRLLVCPTTQSGIRASAVTGLKYFSVGTHEYKELITSFNHILTFILVDMHLLSCRQLQGVMHSMLKIGRTRSKPITVVMCGINTHVILSEREGRSCVFSTLCTAILDRGLEYREAPDHAELQITESQLEAAKKDFIDMPGGRKVKMIIIPLPVRSDPVMSTTAKFASGAEALTNAQVDAVVDALTCILDMGQAPFLMFENNNHMRQIVSHHRLASNYSPTILRVSGYVVEPDGGTRKVIALWEIIRPNYGRPVNSINLDETPAELVWYMLDGDTQGNRSLLSERPVTVGGYACISKARFSPFPPEKDVMAFFTVADKRYRRSDLTTLSYLVRGKLFLASFAKREGIGMEITENLLSLPVNAYDSMFGVTDGY
jgi:hypothetical protein